MSLVGRSGDALADIRKFVHIVVPRSQHELVNRIVVRGCTLPGRSGIEPEMCGDPTRSSEWGDAFAPSPTVILHDVVLNRFTWYLAILKMSTVFPIGSGFAANSLPIIVSRPREETPKASEDWDIPGPC